jgi:hypothetical protein
MHANAWRVDALNQENSEEFHRPSDDGIAPIELRQMHA